VGGRDGHGKPDEGWSEEGRVMEGWKGKREGHEEDINPRLNA